MKAFEDSNGMAGMAGRVAGEAWGKQALYGETEPVACDRNLVEEAEAIKAASVASCIGYPEREQNMQVPLQINSEISEPSCGLGNYARGACQPRRREMRRIVLTLGSLVRRPGQFQRAGPSQCLLRQPAPEMKAIAAR
jgi:hypothetical protein